jgi:hypothetical protein
MEPRPELGKKRKEAESRPEKEWRPKAEATPEARRKKCGTCY